MYANQSVLPSTFRGLFKNSTLPVHFTKSDVQFDAWTVLFTMFDVHKYLKLYNPYTIFKVWCITIQQNSTIPVHLTISAVQPGRADSDSWCGCQEGCCLHTLYLASMNSNQGLKRKRRKKNQNHTNHSFLHLIIGVLSPANLWPVGTDSPHFLKAKLICFSLYYGMRLPLEQQGAHCWWSYPSCPREPT